MARQRADGTSDYLTDWLSTIDEVGQALAAPGEGPDMGQLMRGAGM